MPITRKFLGWNQPALPAVAEFLLEKYARGGAADFSNVVVVLPGSRAGRRLLEVLVEQCERRSLVLTPPRTITVGQLPELLYEPKLPFATDLVQKLAWAHALWTFDRDLILQVIPQLPDEDDTARWLNLGELLWKQHRELAGDGLDFKDVIDRGAAIDGFDETHRWRILRQVQETYLRTLDGLKLWDMQTARLFAIAHHECRAEKEIVLVGTVDMNRAMRQMLDQVADRVTALIHAPQELASSFDAHGCLDPDAWQNVTLNLKTEQVRVVDGPAEQAAAVVRAIAQLNGRYRADEITIGMPDEQLAPQVRRQLDECRLASRWIAGQPLAETPPYRLLTAVANYVNHGRSSDFAALVRHPDIYDWLHRTNPRHGRNRIDGRWLTQLDCYFSKHLQPRLGEWLGEPYEYDQIATVYEAVELLVAPLLGQPRKLGEWTEPLVELLLNVYGQLEIDLENPVERITAAACEQIHAVLVDHTAIPEILSPTVTATQAIRLALEQLQQAAVAPLPHDEAIELLGWLELPLDDAPALVLTAFNEGFIPKSVNSDLFLPNALRRNLGVVDNARRYARDAYALSVLLASRQELTLIAGRRDSRGDPLTPSRLLFATDPETIAARVLTFFKSPSSQDGQPPLSGRLIATREQSAFYVPLPARPVAPLEKISVTAFRSYLACPYRFYLRHVLRLTAQDDAAKELDPIGFGNLLHDVLNRFGQDEEIRSSTNADVIEKFLHGCLEERAGEIYGKGRPAAVAIQLLQLQKRLDAFATWQAHWAGAGWRIVHTEVSNDETPVVFPVGKRSINLDGRIDRIDRNEETGGWAIFDYKSGDSGKTPEEVHRKKKDWIDLQLPLYRFLAKPLGVSDRVGLGYILLPKDVTKVGHVLAQWSDEDLNGADDKAVEVAGLILDGCFWPPADPPPHILTDFAAICQDGAFERVYEEG